MAPESSSKVLGLTSGKLVFLRWGGNLSLARSKNAVCLLIRIATLPAGRRPPRRARGDGSDTSRAAASEKYVTISVREAKVFKDSGKSHVFCFDCA